MEQEKIRQNLEKYIEIIKNKNLSDREVINYFGKIFSDELIGVKLMRALHGEYHIFAHAMQRTH